MQTLAKREGFVAFLDILGYASILENNSPDYVANTIFKVLAKAKEHTREALPKTTKYDPAHNFNYDLIGQISFSDSILISVDLRSIPENNLQNSIFIYLMYCSYFSRMMHDNGLPVRGSISFGEYIMVDNFIAGLPIIESYKLGNRINMEGIVFTLDASNKIYEIFEPNKHALAHVMRPYLVPLNDGSEQNIHILTPSPCTVPIIGDVRQYILAAFWKHHKDISLSVRNKVDNTEQYLRYLKTVHEHLFAEDQPEQPSLKESPTSKQQRKKGQRKRPHSSPLE